MAKMGYAANSDVSQAADICLARGRDAISREVTELVAGALRGHGIKVLVVDLGNGNAPRGVGVSHLSGTNPRLGCDAERRYEAANATEPVRRPPH